MEKDLDKTQTLKDKDPGQWCPICPNGESKKKTSVSEEKGEKPPTG
jgi:hypothetical protein